jgi:hypothetical protein
MEGKEEAELVALSQSKDGQWDISPSSTSNIPGINSKCIIPIRQPATSTRPGTPADSGVERPQEREDHDRRRTSGDSGQASERREANLPPHNTCEYPSETSSKFTMSMEGLEYSRRELTLASEPPEIGYWNVDGETRPVLYLTKSMISLWNSIVSCVNKLQRHREELKELEDEEGNKSSKGQDPTTGLDGANSALFDGIKDEDKEEFLQELALRAAERKRVLRVRINRAEEDLGICWRRLALDWTEILHDSNLFESDLTESLDELGMEDGRKGESVEGNTSKDDITEAVEGNAEGRAELATDPEAKSRAGPEAGLEAKPEARLEAGPEAGPEVELEVRPKPEAEAELETKVGPATKREAEPGAQPRFEQDPKAEAHTGQDQEQMASGQASNQGPDDTEQQAIRREKMNEAVQRLEEVKQEYFKREKVKLVAFRKARHQVENWKAYCIREKKRYMKRVQVGLPEPTQTEFDLDLLKQQVKATAALCEAERELMEYRLHMCQEGIMEPGYFYPEDMESEFGDQDDDGYTLSREQRIIDSVDRAFIMRWLQREEAPSDHTSDHTSEQGDDWAFEMIEWETSSNRASGRNRARIEKHEEARRMLTREVERHIAATGVADDEEVTEEMKEMKAIEELMLGVQGHMGDTTEDEVEMYV